MDFDLDKLRALDARDDENEEESGGGLTDMVKDMMQSIFGEDAPADLGDLMKGFDPGELTNFMLDMENGMGGLFGGSEAAEDDDVVDEEFYEEVDFDELVEKYSPVCLNDSDVRFKDFLKSWLKSDLPSIDEPGITMLGIELDEDMDFEEGINLAYNDENTVWDIKAWLDSKASTFDDDIFDDWYFNEDGGIAQKAENGEDDTDRIYDMLVIAVKELYDEGFLEDTFGKKLPFVISNGRNDYMTALRSVKCCGRELFDKSFFESCGLYDDDEEEGGDPSEE